MQTSGQRGSSRRSPVCRSNACTCRPRGLAAASGGVCCRTTPPRRPWYRKRWADRCRWWAPARTICGTIYRPSGASACAWASMPPAIHRVDCHLVNISRNAYRRGTGAVEHRDAVWSPVSAAIGPDLELDLVPWQIPHVRLRYSSRARASPPAPGGAGACRQRLRGRDAARRDRADHRPLARRPAARTLRHDEGAPCGRRGSDPLQSGSHGGRAAPGGRARWVRPAAA
jgi:hypothetical protein